MSLSSFCLTKTTLIDYPDKVAAAIFTHGCNLRCPYCHNPELVIPPFPEESISQSEFISFLKKRRSVLGGICISGGEPLLHDDLKELIDDIHSFGLSVKIDTNGTRPEHLEKLPCDYIAMDIKTSLEKYSLLGCKDPGAVKASAEYILSSGIRHEFRTTLTPGIVNEEDIQNIGELISGTEKYILTSFRPGKTLDPAFSNIQPYSKQESEKFVQILRDRNIPAFLRGVDSAFSQFTIKTVKRDP